MKNYLTLSIVEQLLSKDPVIWAKNSRSKTASVIANDGNKCVELRVNRMPKEFVSEICEESSETAELIYWYGAEQIKIPLSRRIHARAVEIWKSLAMSQEEIEMVRKKHPEFSRLSTL